MKSALDTGSNFQAKAPPLLLYAVMSSHALCGKFPFPVVCFMFMFIFLYHYFLQVTSAMAQFIVLGATYITFLDDGKGNNSTV
jgi:hypothetical protein